MSNMFAGYDGLVNVDLSKFNTKNVADMSFMFSNCVTLESLDLSNFNTKNVTNMYKMFYGCNSLVKKTLIIYKPNKDVFF